MESFFKIRARGSDLGTEILGGLTTFFAIAYVILVNPNLLSQTGMNGTAVLIATCLSAALGCILSALLANGPYAQAPSIGLAALFTFTLCAAQGYDYTWQQGLAIVLLSGILFLVAALTPVRRMLVSAIPHSLKCAIAAGVGLYLAFTGLMNAGIVVISNGMPALGSITRGVPLLAIIGLLVTGFLLACRVKGALFIGIIATTLIGIPMGITVYTAGSIDFGTLKETMLQFDFHLMGKGMLSLITVLLSFFIIAMIDTAGTLTATAKSANMQDEKGEFIGAEKSMIATAITACIGAALGTAPVTAAPESATGIHEGARTGLSALVTGLMFILAIFLAPFFLIVPVAAVAPALVLVGVMMLKEAAGINWQDFELALPGFLTIAMMPFTNSITDGIAFGFISYTLIKIFRGKFKEIHWLMYVFSGLFLLMYILRSM